MRAKLTVVISALGLLSGCAGFSQRHSDGDVQFAACVTAVSTDAASRDCLPTAKSPPCQFKFTDDPVASDENTGVNEPVFPACQGPRPPVDVCAPMGSPIGSPIWGASLQVAEDAPIWERLWVDQRNYYSRDSLSGLGLIFGAGAIVANTDIDSQLQKHFQASVRDAASDEWFEFLHANKELGNGLYTLPIMGSAWLAGQWLDEQPGFKTIGLWGERSLRGFVVGAPPLLLLQKATGASRPGETAQGSDWQPFVDENGVSGHAFMSALPFITAAKLTENRWNKTWWYVASTIGPLSRVNDNAHYPSQVGLGWGMAFLAASAVQQTDTGQKGWSLQPLTLSNATGLNFQYRW